MKGFLKIVQEICRLLNAVAGLSLTFLMLLTIADVVLRFFKMPIPGTYELVAYAGAIVIGFSLPLTSWQRGHIFVDFLVLKLSPAAQKKFHLFTRSLALVLFFLIGWNLFKMGNDLWKSGEVSPTLQMPFFPIVYAVGVSCLVQCWVLLADMVKILRGSYE